jgi:HTH-type transcriptional regulator / antitoxin HigA
MAENMKIQNNNEYKAVMAQIEVYLRKATHHGGFQSLIPSEVTELQILSLAAEHYEDQVLKLMPLTRKPDSLTDMLNLKMFERKYKQRDLAALLEITPTRLSEVMNGKRKVNMDLAKKLYQKLNIDPKFILEYA